MQDHIMCAAFGDVPKKPQTHSWNIMNDQLTGPSDIINDVGVYTIQGSSSITAPTTAIESTDDVLVNNTFHNNVFRRIIIACIVILFSCQVCTWYVITNTNFLISHEKKTISTTYTAPFTSTMQNTILRRHYVLPFHVQFVSSVGSTIKLSIASIYIPNNKTVLVLGTDTGVLVIATESVSWRVVTPSRAQVWGYDAIYPPQKPGESVDQWNVYTAPLIVIDGINDGDFSTTSHTSSHEIATITIITPES